MKKIQIETAIFFLIFLLAVFLRFFMLSKIPISLNWDETTFAYNAYSILETGKDEYGQPFPLIFKSIGDFKNPLLIYMLVPFIKIFGLNEFGIRFIPALFGALSILTIYFLAKIITSSKKASLFTAFSLAISPWHLFYSRALNELPVSFFLITSGVLCFFLGIKKNKLWLIFSAFLFGLCFYSYYADRVLLPLLICGLGVIFYKELLSNKKVLILPFLLGIILLGPLIVPFFSQGSQQKILNTTLFGYKSESGEVSQTYQEEQFKPFYFLFHNTPVEFTISVSRRYFNHFSPVFLFTEGGADLRFKLYGMGLMYFYEAPLLIFGLFQLIKLKNRFSAFLLFWLMVAPIPAAITRDEYHARRSFMMIAPLLIAVGIGFDYLLGELSRLKNKHAKILLKTGFVFTVLYCLGFYLQTYYIFTPLKNFGGREGWQYGYKQLVEYIDPIKNKYDKIIVDNTYQGPYIFFLFYQKYPPAKYQPQAKLVYECSGCLGEGSGYDNFEFRPLYWPNERGAKRTLFAGPPERIPYKDIDPKQTRLIKTIYFPDGTPAFLVVETVN